MKSSSLKVKDLKGRISSKMRALSDYHNQEVLEQETLKVKETKEGISMLTMQIITEQEEKSLMLSTRTVEESIMITIISSINLSILIISDRFSSFQMR
jgi:hypothetical protein